MSQAVGCVRSMLLLLVSSTLSHAHVHVNVDLSTLLINLWNTLAPSPHTKHRDKLLLQLR